MKSLSLATIISLTTSYIRPYTDGTVRVRVSRKIFPIDGAMLICQKRHQQDKIGSSLHHQPGLASGGAPKEKRKRKAKRKRKEIGRHSMP